MLRPDDMEVGECIVIVEFIDDAPSFESDPYESYFAAMRRQGASGLLGIPLRVVAVNLPFIAVQPPNQQREASPFALFSGGASSPRVLSLDVRTFSAMKAHDGFVEAFFPTKPQGTLMGKVEKRGNDWFFSYEGDSESA